MAQPPLTGDRQHRDDVLRIAELTVNTIELRGYTFSNCKLIGPAILVPLGNTSFNGCGFEGELDAIFWEIPPERHWIVGAVAVVDCTFSSCGFSQIGLAGPAALKEMMRSGGLA